MMERFDHESPAFTPASLNKLGAICNTNLIVANHWHKLKGILKQQEYIKQLENRAANDREVLRNEAALIIQNWWRSRRTRLADRKLVEVVMDTMDGSQMEEEYQQQLLDEIVTNSRDLITLEDTEEEQQQQENCQHTMDADKDGLATNTTNMNTTSKERSMEECLVDVASTLIVSNNLDLEVDSVQDMENIQMELENKHRAITRIQAWWRGFSYRRHQMSFEHKERLKNCVQALRDAPCTESNPREERTEPLNQRIQRHLGGLLSTVLTERKVCALRLDRLAGHSHVAIECMLNMGVFDPVLECFADLNRSEAHLYVIRPLCSLCIKLLSYKPFADPFAQSHLGRLISTAIHQIHNNYKDANVVVEQTQILKMLSAYPGFSAELKTLRFDWFMQKFRQRFGRLGSTDVRSTAFRQLCALRNP